MDQTEIAERLIADLASGLRSVAAPEPDTRDYLDRLLAEMGATALRPNGAIPEGLLPTPELRSILESGEDWRSDPVLKAVKALTQRFSWIRADRFYREPEHRHFSERIWGGLIVGEADAPFSAEDRYIALLILLLPNTTYPLHAHRIEEAYYVLSGQADWSHDGRSWTRLSRGGLFHNRSWEPHAIRTSDEPMIAMGLYLPPFGWEGGLLPEAEADRPPDKT